MFGIVWRAPDSFALGAVEYDVFGDFFAVDVFGDVAFFVHLSQDVISSCGSLFHVFDGREAFGGLYEACECCGLVEG